MSKKARDTIDDANERRISERDAALTDPHFSLLADQDRLTEIMRSLLGQHPAKSRRQPHPPLFRLSTMAPLAHAVRDALNAVMVGSECEKAVESATLQCLDEVEENVRPRWRASARDVAMLAARDAVLAGVDRFLVELAAARPVKANVVAKPLPRRTQRNDAYRDAYWATRGAPLNATASAKAAGSKLACPQPSAFSIADEAYWLLVLVQQMAWPLPDCFNDLYPETILRRPFSVDQVRYLIRRDWKWTALHCARAGVLIDQLDPNEAAMVLARQEARGEAPQRLEQFGRWPEPTPEAQAAWEERKRDYFDELVVKEALSPADTAFALALVVAQCGWPMPALVTRLFPADWVTRRLPAHLVAAALRRSDGFNLLDAAMAGTNIWELPLPGIDAFSQRQSNRDLRAIEGHFDPRARIGWLRHFFGAQGQGPVALRDRLEMQMRDAINGADRKPEDRITLQAFAQTKAIVSPSKTQPAPVQSRPALPMEEQSRIARDQEPLSEPVFPDEPPADPVEAGEALPRGIEVTDLAAVQSEVAATRSDLSATELRASIKAAFEGELADVERQTTELASRYPNITLIDVVRALGVDRRVSLARALSVFGLEPNFNPLDLQPGADQDAWYEIIHEAQSNAINKYNIESEYVKFLQENYRLPSKWIKPIAIHSRLSIYSGYKDIFDVILFGDELTEFHFPNKLFNISHDTSHNLSRLYFFSMLLIIIDRRPNFEIENKLFYPKIFHNTRTSNEDRIELRRIVDIEIQNIIYSLSKTGLPDFL